MDLLNRDELKQLAHVNAHPCVSLYMPAMRVESENAQNPIRFKNLLREAHDQLKAHDLSESTVQKLLQPAWDRMDDTPFWHHQSDGLAMFLTPDEVYTYRLPLNFEELVFTGGRFHLKPLFPMVATNNRYFVLALSQNSVRLYQATHYSVSEIHSTEIPSDIYDLIKYEVNEQSVQHHIGAKTGNQQHDAVFHGQGRQDGDDTNRPKDELLRFFNEVNRGITEVLKDETAPLILAGVKYYLPLYREVNSYGHLVEDSVVAGNPDETKPKELHTRSWELVEPIFLEQQRASIETFDQHLGQENGLASTELEDIVASAYYSRVDTLFVPVGRHVWGTFDEEANRIERHDDRRPTDDDLLDFAAMHTYLNGGTVHALQPHNMPVLRSDLAATYRFPIEAQVSEA